MSWEWSHTHEAYDIAKQNLELLSKEKLVEIYGEWTAYDAEGSHGVDWSLAYAQNTATAENLSHDCLVEYIWDRAVDYRTCTNGGHNAYVCPDGCGCHLVSFSTPEEQEEELKCTQ